MRILIAFQVAVLALCLTVAESLQRRDQIHQLRARVDCLEHPHGESSIAGRFVGTGSSRRFVVTQPARRTGCP